MILSPTEEDLQRWATVVEQALPTAALGARLALSSLLCAVIQKDKAVSVLTQEIADLRAARPHLRLLPKPSCGIDGCSCGDVLNHGIAEHGADW